MIALICLRALSSPRLDPSCASGGFGSFQMYNQVHIKWRIDDLRAIFYVNDTETAEQSMLHLNVNDTETAEQSMRHPEYSPPDAISLATLSKPHSKPSATTGPLATAGNSRTRTTCAPATLRSCDPATPAEVDELRAEARAAAARSYRAAIQARRVDPRLAHLPILQMLVREDCYSLERANERVQGRLGRMENHALVAPPPLSEVELERAASEPFPLRREEAKCGTKLTCSCAGRGDKAVISQNECFEDMQMVVGGQAEWGARPTR